MNLKLVCESPWVFIPEHLNLAYAPRTFSVRVDPCGLPVGEHFTWVSKTVSPIFQFCHTKDGKKKRKEKNYS